MKQILARVMRALLFYFDSVKEMLLDVVGKMNHSRKPYAYRKEKS